MRMLFVGTHGSESPTHAVLPLLQAQGALEEGHAAEVILVGDAVVLMKDAVARATIPVGWPPVGDVLAKLIDHQIPIYVWGGCSTARGVVEADLQGKNAKFITPNIAAQRIAAADRVLTFWSDVPTRRFGQVLGSKRRGEFVPGAAPTGEHPTALRDGLPMVNVGYQVAPPLV